MASGHTKENQVRCSSPRTHDQRTPSWCFTANSACQLRDAHYLCPPWQWKKHSLLPRAPPSAACSFLGSKSLLHNINTASWLPESYPSSWLSVSGLLEVPMPFLSSSKCQCFIIGLLTPNLAPSYFPCPAPVQYEAKFLEVIRPDLS